MTQCRILYVDDDPDIRAIARMCLELDPTFLVRECDSGHQALIDAAEWNPNLILLDVMMPGIDGPETLRQLREDERTAEIPVVFVTARTGVEDVQRFTSIGAKGVIAKPFEPMSLADKVGSFL